MLASDVCHRASVCGGPLLGHDSMCVHPCRGIQINFARVNARVRREQPPNPNKERKPKKKTQKNKGAKLILPSRMFERLLVVDCVRYPATYLYINDVVT